MKNKAFEPVPGYSVIQRDISRAPKGKRWELRPDDLSKLSQWFRTKSEANRAIPMRDFVPSSEKNRDSQEAKT